MNSRFLTKDDPRRLPLRQTEASVRREAHADHSDIVCLTDGDTHLTIIANSLQ
jgi:hypothetical protein